MKGETEQANDLARYLRRLTRGVPQRELEERFGTGRTVWGEYLSGAKIIPADKLEALVAGLVPDARVKAELAHAAGLLRSAEESFGGSASRTTLPLPRPAPPQQLYERLVEAREQQVRAERAFHKSHQMVLILLNLVAGLQAHCESLKKDRERALAGERNEIVAQVQILLAVAEEELSEANVDLGRARKARRIAEMNKVTAQRVFENCRRAVDELSETSLHPSYAAVRGRITEQLDKQDEELADLAELADLSGRAPAPSAEVVSATVMGVAGLAPQPQARIPGGFPGLFRRRRSSRRNREDQVVEELVEELKRAREEQRAFGADVSQLRHPIAALLLRVELLSRELQDSYDEEVGIIRTEGHRLASAMDGLMGLGLARQDSFLAERIDVTRHVRERVAAWLPTAHLRSIALRCEGLPSAYGWADPIGFVSALDAVLDNAFKFNQAGDEVIVTITTGNDHVTVRLADTGAGLTEEELLRVGDRFWRSPRHHALEGAGTGLATARVLLQATGSSLDFALNHPSGLVVTISIPHPPWEGRSLIRV
ncbi:ATP-binding protein [Kitasatospora sp. NPDC048365]|uniref:sensor histidine kinase n=1 Tax=Kitasatospora sp. NPDC048365 TaxID=3364050 RepID=UPI003710B6EF